MKAFKIDRKYKTWASKYGKEEKRRRLTSDLFLAPSFLGVMLFFVLPFVVVLVYSVVNNPIRLDFVGFSNFVKVLKNTAF